MSSKVAEVTGGRVGGAIDHLSMNTCAPQPLLDTRDSVRSGSTGPLAPNTCPRWLLFFWITGFGAMLVQLPEDDRDFITGIHSPKSLSNLGPCEDLRRKAEKLEKRHRCINTTAQPKFLQLYRLVLSIHLIASPVVAHFFYVWLTISGSLAGWCAFIHFSCRPCSFDQR